MTCRTTRPQNYRTFLRILCPCVVVTALFITTAAYPAPHKGGTLSAPPGVRLEQKQAEDVFAALKSLQAPVTSASASMRQTKSTPLLKKPLISEGTVYLKKPNLLRMEIKSPKRVLTVVDGAVLWEYQPDVKEAKRYVLSEQFMANQAVKFFSSAMNVSLPELSERFSVSVYKNADVYVIDLAPSTGAAARFIERIRLHFNEGSAMPHRNEVFGKNGSLTVTEFSNGVVNPPLAADAFTFSLPKGAMITNEFAND